jgi:hypothetical protein
MVSVAMDEDVESRDAVFDRRVRDGASDGIRKFAFYVCVSVAHG